MHGFVGPPRVWKRFPRTGGLAVSRAFGDTNLSTAGRCSNPSTLHVNLSRCYHSDPATTQRIPQKCVR